MSYKSLHTRSTSRTARITFKLNDDEDESLAKKQQAHRCRQHAGARHESDREPDVGLLFKTDGSMSRARTRHVVMVLVVMVLVASFQMPSKYLQYPEELDHDQPKVTASQHRRHTTGDRPDDYRRVGEFLSDSTTVVLRRENNQAPPAQGRNLLSSPPHAPEMFTIQTGSTTTKKFIVLSNATSVNSTSDTTMESHQPRVTTSVKAPSANRKRKPTTNYVVVGNVTFSLPNTSVKRMAAAMTGTSATKKQASSTKTKKNAVVISASNSTPSRPDEAAETVDSIMTERISVEMQRSLRAPKQQKKQQAVTVTSSTLSNATVETMNVQQSNGMETKNKQSKKVAMGKSKVKNAPTRTEEKQSGTMIKKKGTMSIRKKREKRAVPKAKQTLVIDVGPEKMGTTHIQSIFVHPDTRETLLQDNFVYLGKVPSEMRKQAATDHDIYSKSHFFINTKKKGLQLRHQFVGALRQIYKKGLSAIIISEDLAQINEEEAALLYKKLSNRWNIQIIATYRRLFDYLPSLYSQNVRPKAWNAQSRLWPGKMGGKQGAVTGKPILPFDLDDRGRFSDRFLDIESSGMHPTARSLHHLKKYLNWSVFNLDDDLRDVSLGDSYMIHLTCNVIRQLPNTCKAASNGVIGVNGTFDNPSFQINYDILAVAAYNEGLIRPGLSRMSVTRWIRERQEVVLGKNHHDFPVTCPSNATLARLLNASLASELSVYPELATAEAQERHAQRFAAKVAAKKFCNINPRLILRFAAWQNFFRSL